MTPLYKFAYGFTRSIGRLLYPLDLTGQENLNVEGGVMVVCNHVSLRDPILVASLFNRQPAFMGKKELFKNKLAAKLLRQLGGFPVDRGAADMSAIRESVNVLKAGKILIVFPQGHRFPKDDDREIKNGASLLAIWSKVPVLPVHITVPYRLFRKLKIRVGQPVDLSDLTKIDEASLTEASRRISQAIWSE